ncbi:MAG: hypothetical protein NT091_05270, partial [Candidatus Falkowbacteria bacterium]|nr:hypothetical protein [Candidatus Falkowbacteria bacterium]
LSYGSESWVKYAAIKTLQDLEDVRSFNIEEYLDYLEFIENPNGEDLEKLKKYNKTFFKMYANPRQSGIESYYDMWRGLEVGDRLRELALKIKDEAEKYSQNESTMLIVRGIYQKTLEGILTL